MLLPDRKFTGKLFRETIKNFLKLFFFLSDGKTQHSLERGARAFYFASFHSTMSVGVLMAPNIYEITMLLRAQFAFGRVDGRARFSFEDEAVSVWWWRKH